MEEQSRHEFLHILSAAEQQNRVAVLSRIENLAAGASPIVPLKCSTLNESAIAEELASCDISCYFSQNSTPVKESAASNSESQFFKKHSQSAQTTPSKSASLQKLGSPEVNEILYGTGRVIKRTQAKQSPAKKRLFDASDGGNGSNKKRSLLRKHLKHDPVAFFWRDRSMLHIIEKIFAVLSDRELYCCRQVSPLWMRALLQCNSVTDRLNLFMSGLQIDKENYIPAKIKQQSAVEYPIGGDSFLEIAQALSKEQRLEKCPNCGSASIIERSIGQCQKFTCGYIYCILCKSCSTTGPEHFFDKCQGSVLLVDRPKKVRAPWDSPPPPSERSLNDSSLPSFFLHGHNHDSGYQSELSVNSSSSYSSSNSTSFTLSSSSSSANNSSTRRSWEAAVSDGMQGTARRSLGNCNRNIGNAPCAQAKLNYVPVLPQQQQQQQHSQRKRTAAAAKAETPEPPSPPKTRYVACSAKSKRNLRRLLL